MYAVVRTGGKQYRVARNDVIVVEKLAAEPGVDIELDQVLAMGDGAETVIGTPLVDGARVAATVLDQARAAKIIVFKKKRRKNYTRTHGHRQQVTVLRVTEILAKGQQRSARPARAEPAEPAAEAEAAPAEAAAKKSPARKSPAKKAPAKKSPARKAPAKKSPAKKAAKKTARKKAPARKRS